MFQNGSARSLCWSWCKRLFGPCATCAKLLEAETQITQNKCSQTQLELHMFEELIAREESHLNSDQKVTLKQPEKGHVGPRVAVVALVGEKNKFSPNTQTNEQGDLLFSVLLPLGGFALFESALWAGFERKTKTNPPSSCCFLYTFRQTHGIRVWTF